MISKFKRGLTPAEAALIAMGLNRFDSLLEATNTLKRDEQLFMDAKAEIASPYNDGYYSISPDVVEDYYTDCENLEEAIQIKDALLDEVCIAIDWHDHISGEVELYGNGFDAQPNNETCLEVYQIIRRAPDGEYSFYPIPTQTTITKISLAKWFEANLPDKAKLFDPSESYKTAKTGYTKELLAKQVAPIQQAPPTAINDNKSITALNKEIKQLWDEIELLKQNSFTTMTSKLQTMLVAQNKYWTNYDENKLCPQQEISNFIAEELKLNITANGTNRIADELAKAIQPDEIKRK